MEYKCFVKATVVPAGVAGCRLGIRTVREGFLTLKGKQKSNSLLLL